MRRSAQRMIKTDDGKVLPRDEALAAEKKAADKSTQTKPADKSSAKK